MKKPMLPDNPTPEQFSTWELWHIMRAKKSPNKPIKLASGYYFFYVKRFGLGKLFEIYRAVDEDTGKFIGWYPSPFNDYCFSDPYPTKKACIEYLMNAEIDL